MLVSCWESPPRRRLLLFCLIAAFARGVSAQDIVAWDGEAGTMIWSDDINWDTNAEPTNAEIADIGNATVELDDLEQAGGLIVGAGGQIRLPGAHTLEVRGDVFNDGVIDVANSASSNAQFIAAGSMLEGSGEIVLRDGGFPNRTATVRAGVDPVTHAASHTVRGEGVVVGAWNNLGTFRAEDTSGDGEAVLVFNNLPTFNNPGELRSSPTGTLRFTSTHLTLGATGRLITDTRAILFSGSNSVTGGSLDAEDGGTIQHLGGLLDLFGVVNNATIDVADRLRTDAAGIVNNGRINIDAGESGNASLRLTEGGGEIGGTGEIVLARQATSSISSSIALAFTHGADHTIRGAGTINLRPTNNGTIRAEPVVGNVLTINNNVINHGVMAAAADAVLRYTITGNTQQGPDGVIEAEDGGVVLFNAGFSLAGGSLQTDGSGVLVVNGDNVFFEGVTNRGSLDMVANSTLNLTGATFTNDGTVLVNSDDGFAVPGPRIVLQNDLVLDGDGEVVLNTPAGLPAAAIDAFEHQLVNDATHTIRGNGVILGALENRGRIEGDSASEPVSVFGRLTGDGPLSNVQLAANVFTSAVHAPGDADPAVVTLEGSYEIVGAFNRLEIGLGGTALGESDRLDSAGQVALNGVLDVGLIGGYVPGAGDRFTIIEADGGVSGGFASLALPTNRPNLVIDWAVEVNATDVTLEAVRVTPLPGDYNADGVVDAADYTVWRDRLGLTGLPAFAAGDGNGDGLVTIDDYDVWRANFGMSAPAAVVVPEPTSAVGLAAGFLVFACGASYGRRVMSH